MHPYLFAILDRQKQLLFLKSKIRYNYTPKKILMKERMAEQIAKQIINIITNHFNIYDVSQLKKRIKKNILALKFICYFLRKKGYKYQYIGKLLDRNHSAILYHYNFVNNILNANKQVQKANYEVIKAYEELKYKLKNNGIF